jgi:hypothetical protein
MEPRCEKEGDEIVNAKEAEGRKAMAAKAEFNTRRRDILMWFSSREA